MKRIISLCLVAVMVFSLLPAVSVNAYSNPYPVPALTGNQAQDVANIAVSQLGYTYDGGTAYGAWWTTVTNWGFDYTTQPWCAMFACWCLNQAGVGLGKGFDTSSALTSSMRSFYQNKAFYEGNFATTPRAGDILFFGSSPSSVSHVAIAISYDAASNRVTFVGGNQNGKVTQYTCGWYNGATYGRQYVLGYGRANFTAANPADITLSNYNYPTSVTAGQPFYIRGTVTSGQKLTSIDIYCYSDTGETKTGTTVYPNALTYNLNDADSYLGFSKLSPGVYAYQVTAHNLTQSVTLIDKVFTVLPTGRTVDDGAYYLQASDGLVLSTGATSAVSLAKLQQQQSQAFQVVYKENGYYQIRNYSSGLYLTASGGSISQTYKESENTALNWYILPLLDGWCLASADGSTCMTATGQTLQNTKPAFDQTRKFQLLSTDCNFETGNKITFDCQGGTLPDATTTATVNSVNGQRTANALVLYNIPHDTLTDATGMEVSVDAGGKLVSVRNTNDPMPSFASPGGFVLSALGTPVSLLTTISQMNTCYIGFDYDTMQVSVYDDYNGYLRNHKYVSNGAAYGDLPTPQRSGYRFDGWYTSPMGGMHISKNILYAADTLYAHWTKADSATGEACTGGADCVSSRFTDAPGAGNWAHAGIDFVVNNELFAGVSDTLFQPDGVMTRAMTVTVLWRLAGRPEPEGTNVYTDVPDNEWYTTAVIWGTETGVVSGMGDGVFDPTGNVTREQLASILYRYARHMGYDISAQADISAFPDAGQVSSWASTSLKWANAMGLVSGSASGNSVYLMPRGSATRAQVASILMRFVQNIAQ